MLHLLPSLVGVLIAALWLLHVAGRQNVDPKFLNEVIATLLLRGDRARAEEVAKVAPYAPYCTLVQALLAEPDIDAHSAITARVIADARQWNVRVRAWLAASVVLLAGPVVTLGIAGDRWVIGAAIGAVFGGLGWSAVLRTQRTMLDRAVEGGHALSILLREVRSR